MSAEVFAAGSASDPEQAAQYKPVVFVEDAAVLCESFGDHQYSDAKAAADRMREYAAEQKDGAAT
jgi:hypothetical protein